MTTLDTRRIYIFLAFAFGLAWATALVIFLTGGLVDSPALIPDTRFTLALVLIAGVFMFSPAIANVLTRLITREGRIDLYLQPQFKINWRFWVAAWFVPALLTVIGAVIFFLIFPSQFDPSLSILRDALAAAAQAGQEIPIPVEVLAVIQILQGLLLSPVLNSLFTFGEEFGWRGYLQPKLMPLGWRKAMLLMGVIWGVWHWPIILMGHNYSLEYPGVPWAGPLAMVWFTFVVGTVFGYWALRGGSVWPAVIGHAAINGIAAIGILFSDGNPNPALGPLPVGMIGSIAWTAYALWLFLRANPDQQLESAEQV